MKIANVSPAAKSTRESRLVELLVSSIPTMGVKTNVPATPEFAIPLVVDDGTAENSIGVNDSTSSYQFIWLNRFTPDAADFPFNLNQIQVLFPAGQANVGDALDLVVYQDEDGNPANGATLLATYNVTVQSVDGSTWSVYDLPTPLFISGPGDVLIAAINRWIISGVSPAQWPASIDSTVPQVRSWIGWWNIDPPDPAVLPPDNTFGTIDSLGFAGNWLVRGYGETISVDIPWLSETPTFGTVDPGFCTTIDVTFDSTGLTNGTYTAALNVASNDPDEPTINVPVTLNVGNEPLPNIVVNAPPLEMTLAPDQTGTLDFSIDNIGSADLTWSAADFAAWLSESPASGTILPGGSTQVQVTFDSTGLAPGSYQTTIEITSNDPDTPSVVLPVTLIVSIDNPNYDTSFKAAPGSVFQSDPIHYSVVINNTGGPGLATTMEDVIPAGTTYVAGSVTCSDGSCSYDAGLDAVLWNGQLGPGAPLNTSFADTTGTNALLATWPGPDGYGYEGELVNFNWIDLSTTGTPINGFSDDNYQGPFPIGFGFDFYGSPQTDFYASSNGFISFGAGSSSLSNQCPLPSATTPDNLIAMLWDDLNFTTSGSAYYQTFDPCPIGTGACLVVEYANTAHYGGAAGSAGTWEAVLYPNGDVVLQYLDPGVESGSGSTEGIEDTNFGGDFGLTYACDTGGSLAPNTAVLFTAHPALPSQVTIEFDVMADVCATTINNLATIDDPGLISPVTVTASTLVECELLPDITVDPLSLSQTLAPDAQATQPMDVCNVGEGPLDWSLEEAAAAKKPSVVLYDNGPLVTHPGGGAGGADASALQTGLGMGTYGFGHQYDLGYWVADDFEVSDPGGWDLTAIDFFAYQTNSGNNSSITAVAYQILDGAPNAGGNVVCGDMTTNRMTNTTWSNIYRVLDTDMLNTQRPVMADTVSIAPGCEHLAAGTYWLVWTTDGSLTSGPWAPPISILGQTTTGNGMQTLDYGSTWADLIDVGPQGLPFIIEGLGGGYDIPWLSETPTSGTIDPGFCTTVDVTFDSTGLTEGTYTGALNVNSNDPDEPTVNVPVELIVAASGAPDITLTPDALSAQANPGDTVTQPLVIGNVGDADLTWELYDGVPSTGWSDNFDSYQPGTNLHGVNGWKGWDNSPAAGGLVSTVQNRSFPNSVAIEGASDLTHPYSGYTSGAWVYTAWQFIPNDFSGMTYFILLNTYNDGGPYNWSLEVSFDSSTGLITNDGPDGGTLPMLQGQWVEIRVEIDLDADTQSVYYGGDLLFTGSWTEGMSGGGILNIANVDLFANGATAVYYDDVSLAPAADPQCGVYGDVPWLSTDPTSGTTAPGMTSDVTVFFDATGLSVGTYTADLCAASNDPDEPLIPIPVTFTVVEPSADLSIEKTASAAEVKVGETIEYTLVVTNQGPNTAVAVSVEDILPALVEFVSASTQCSEAGGTVTCDLGDLASGGSVTLTITVTALDVGSASNTAEVESATLDPDLTNNTSTAVTTINPSGPTLYYFFLPIIQKQ